MTISPTSRRWLAVIMILLGGVLLWIGYREDAARDAYYDCRQTAMDSLHTALGAELDEDPKPTIWVPKWQESFHDWDLMLTACKETSVYDVPDEGDH